MGWFQRVPKVEKHSPLPKQEQGGGSEEASAGGGMGDMSRREDFQAFNRQMGTEWNSRAGPCYLPSPSFVSHIFQQLLQMAPSLTALSLLCHLWPGTSYSPKTSLNICFLIVLYPHLQTWVNIHFHTSSAPSLRGSCTVPALQGQSLCYAFHSLLSLCLPGSNTVSPTPPPLSFLSPSIFSLFAGAFLSPSDQA